MGTGVGLVLRGLLPMCLCYYLGNSGNGRVCFAINKYCPVVDKRQHKM